MTPPPIEIAATRTTPPRIASMRDLFFIGTSILSRQIVRSAPYDNLSGPLHFRKAVLPQIADTGTFPAMKHVVPANSFRKALLLALLRLAEHEGSDGRIA